MIEDRAIFAYAAVAKEESHGFQLIVQEVGNRVRKHEN